jgi:HK97 family phage major capsid protein
MNEIETLKNDIIEKAVQKIMAELNSKFITHDELVAAFKEFTAHKDVYSVEPGLLAKTIRGLVIKGPMLEGTGSAGGYLVPPEYVNRILDVAIQQSVVYPKVTKIPVASNQMYLTGVSSAVTFSYPGENATTTPTAPIIYQAGVPIKKGMALVDIPNELLADATIGGAVDAYLVNLIGRAFGKEMDRLILVGDTSSGDPFNGILNTSGITYVVEATGHTSDVTYDALIDAINAIPSDYKLNPFWIAHRTFYAKAFEVKTTTNQPVLNPEAKTLVGYPFERVEVMPSTFAASKPIALFCDPVNVMFGMRQELQITASKEAKFDLDLTELKATFRFGFYIAYPSTFVVIKTSAS